MPPLSYIDSRSDDIELYPAPLLVRNLLAKEDCQNELCSFSGSSKAMIRHDCFFDSDEGKAISASVKIGKQKHEKQGSDLEKLCADLPSMSCTSTETGRLKESEDRGSKAKLIESTKHQEVHKLRRKLNAYPTATMIERLVYTSFTF
jgi:hypothetical protein